MKNKVLIISALALLLNCTLDDAAAAGKHRRANNSGKNASYRQQTSTFMANYISKDNDISKLDNKPVTQKKTKVLSKLGKKQNVSAENSAQGNAILENAVSEKKILDNDESNKKIVEHTDSNIESNTEYDDKTQKIVSPSMSTKKAMLIGFGFGALSVLASGAAIYYSRDAISTGLTYIATTGIGAKAISGFSSVRSGLGTALGYISSGAGKALSWSGDILFGSKNTTVTENVLGKVVVVDGVKNTSKLVFKVVNDSITKPGNNTMMKSLTNTSAI